MQPDIMVQSAYRHRWVAAWRKGRALIGAWLQDRRDQQVAGQAWSQAGGFADAGELTARWLEGSVPGHPSYFGSSPDEETAGLVPALAALNRAGFVTIMSQPGADEVIDGVRWKQRATVTGYVTDTGVLESLMQAANTAGLWFVAHSPSSFARADRSMMVVGGNDEPNVDGWFTITTRQDEPCTRSGGMIPPRGTRFDFRRWCPRTVANEMVDACQLTVIDPDWNRDDRLWPALVEALTDRTITGSP